MTLPLFPNAIRASAINTEKGSSDTAQFSINSSPNSRLLAGKTAINTEIKYSDFHGKTFGFVVSLPRVVQRLDLYTAALNAGWDRKSALTMVLDIAIHNKTGNDQFSSVNNNGALEILGTYPNGVTVVIKRGVFGRGGDNAHYKTASSILFNQSSYKADAGHAIVIAVGTGTPFVKIIADAPIYGGGGAGGGYFSAGGGAGGGHGGDGYPAPGIVTPTNWVPGGAGAELVAKQPGSFPFASPGTIPNDAPVTQYPNWVLGSAVGNLQPGSEGTGKKETGGARGGGGGGGGFGTGLGYSDWPATGGGNPYVLNDPGGANGALTGGGYTPTGQTSYTQGNGGYAGGGAGSDNFICGWFGGNGGANDQPGSPATILAPSCSYSSWFTFGGGGGGFGAPGGSSRGGAVVAGGAGGKAISRSAPGVTTFTIVDNGPTTIGRPWIRGATS